MKNRKDNPIIGMKGEVFINSPATGFDEWYPGEILDTVGEFATIKIHNPDVQLHTRYRVKIIGTKFIATVTEQFMRGFLFQNDLKFYEKYKKYEGKEILVDLKEKK